MPTDNERPPIESAALTLRDAGYIVGGLITAIGLALGGAGAYWHLSGHQDMQDQQITTLKEERAQNIARRDKQVEDLQRTNADQDQRITTLRSDYSNVQVQIGKVEVKLDDSIVLLRQLVDAKQGGPNR